MFTKIHRLCSCWRQFTDCTNKQQHDSRLGQTPQTGPHPCCLHRP